MNPAVQTIVALAVVAVAAIWLLIRALRHDASHGCGGECGAVSPEVKKLQARLKR